MDAMLNLLQKIRQKPGLYLGKPSLTILYHFVAGYSFRAVEVNPDYNDCMDGFQEFVQKYYSYGITQRGWETIILEHSESQEEAFDTFFELFDKFIAERI